MSLPLRGEWTIIQGTDRPVVPSPAVPYSHRGWAAFCLDFGELQETEAKGQPVVAVADGTVVFLRDTSPDTQSNEQVPGCVRCAPDNPNDISCAYEPNEVLIKHADNEYSSYLHLEQGSVPATIKQRLATGDLVRAGEQIGLLGRSGTAGYHLHFAYLRDPVLPDERGLNPGEDTPLPGECGYSRAVPSYTEIITRPFEFSNYQVRRLDGTFIGVGRGTPQENEVVRAGSGCLSALAQLVRSWL
jgi:hypothetical protein